MTTQEKNKPPVFPENKPSTKPFKPSGKRRTYAKPRKTA